MEDLFKFLIIAVVIIVSIAKQFTKEPEKTPRKKPLAPAGEAEEGMPVPPVAPIPVSGNASSVPSAPTSMPPTASSLRPRRKAGVSPMVTPTVSTPSSSRAAADADASSEYGIHSAEEARRAIIWSEILQRKYC